MKHVGLFVAGLIVGAASASGATLHVDTFDADVLGWTGGVAPEFVAAGGAGDGGGFAMVLPGSGGNFAAHNSTAAWTGDFAAIGAARVRADFMSPPSSPAPLEMRLVLYGPDSTSERWTSSVAQTVPNDGVWRNYSFTIGAADLAHVQGSATYNQLLAGVVRVMLRHDPGSPDAGGTGVELTSRLGIDNVELAAAPPDPVPGDFDGDGQVDGDDLTGPQGFLARYGNDLDGNSFLTWQQSLGPPGIVAQTAVPEPGAGVLLLAAASLGIRRVIRGGIRGVNRRD